MFKTFFYQPLFNLLIIIYQALPVPDLGLAVIILTLIVKIILSPLTISTFKSQKILAKIQPRMSEIQKNIKNKEEQTKQILKLYREEKVNPFSGFLALIVQLPILFALYKIFSNGFNIEAMKQISYSFVKAPEIISPLFLNIIDLSKPNIFLAIIAGVLQFFQLKFFQKPVKTKEKGFASDFSKMMQSQMLFIFPILIFYIVFKFGSLIGLYLVVFTIFSILEQRYIEKKYKL